METRSPSASAWSAAPRQRTPGKSPPRRGTRWAPRFPVAAKQSKVKKPFSSLVLHFRELTQLSGIGNAREGRQRYCSETLFLFTDYRHPRVLKSNPGRPAGDSLSGPAAVLLHRNGSAPGKRHKTGRCSAHPWDRSGCNIGSAPQGGRCSSGAERGGLRSAAHPGQPSPRTGHRHRPGPARPR